MGAVHSSCDFEVRHIGQIAKWAVPHPISNVVYRAANNPDKLVVKVRRHRYKNRPWIVARRLSWCTSNKLRTPPDSLFRSISESRPHIDYRLSSCSWYQSCQRSRRWRCRANHQQIRPCNSTDNLSGGVDVRKFHRVSVQVPVVSVAHRLVNDDSYMAQDVARTVFVDLARSTQRLDQGLILGPFQN